MTYYSDTNIAIEIGDTLRYSNIEGVVVANLDAAQYTADFTEEDWGSLETGIIAVFEEIGIVHFSQVDAGVEFVNRRENNNEN